jgi:predicted component of type VI protein secretion system
MKITKQELKEIIKEEIEAVLNEKPEEDEVDPYEKPMESPLAEEDKDWIQKAVDPEHEGDCTPMTKSTCTPARKALAKRFKKAAKKKEKKGGTGWQGKV